MNKLQLRKIFNLEGYILDKVEEIGDEVLLYCHLQKRSMTFDKEISKSVNQSRERKIAHTIFEQKKVFIIIIQRRFYFSKHRKILWEPLPQVKPRQQCTTTFKKTLFWPLETQIIVDYLA